MHRSPNGFMALALLLIGGAVGAVAYGVQFSLFMLTRESTTEITAGTVAAMLIVMPLLLSLFTVPSFVLGMILVGWPVWSVMNRLGWRAPWQGALAGGLGAGLVGEALVATIIPYGTLMTFVWLALPGVVAGLVAWLLIYSKAIRPPLRPVPPS